MTHLPSKSTDFVSSDSDAMIQQLLILDDGEVDIPINPTSQKRSDHHKGFGRK